MNTHSRSTIWNITSPRAHFLRARSLASRQPEPSPELAGSRLFSGGGSVAIYAALHDEANTSFLFAVLIPLLSPGASQERRLVGLSRPCSQCRALSSAAYKLCHIPATGLNVITLPFCPAQSVAHQGFRDALAAISGRNIGGGEVHRHGAAGVRRW